MFVGKYTSQASKSTRRAANTVAKGGAAVIQNVQARTSEGIKKVFGGPLSHIAKNESNARPCPRLALCCCTGIVTGGLAEPGIFRSPADPEELYCLYGAFENGRCHLQSMHIHMF